MRRLMGIGLVVSLIAGLVFGYRYAGEFLIATVIITPLELLFRRHRQKLHRPGYGTDVIYFLVGQPIRIAGAFVGALLALAAMAILTPWLFAGLIGVRSLVGALPFAVRIVAAVAVFTLSDYWVHRALHTVPFLWQFHSIHHSSKQLDWIAGVRGHPVETLWGGVGLMPVILLGFDTSGIAVFVIINGITAVMAHANVRWRLRPLQKVILTPEVHHWHHSVEAQESNYSGILPIWDVAFGTFHAPRDVRPSNYGTSTPVPDGLLGQVRYPFRSKPGARPGPGPAFVLPGPTLART